jgi:SOS response associated peptidase (SRAP)
VCNDFGNRVPYDDYLRAFSEIRVPLRWPTTAPNLEPRDDIWPTDPAPVFRCREGGIEMVQLRWGFPPARPKGAPVINFRSEGRRFPKGRCLIPASHFFEFTGTKSSKSKWKFTKVGEDWFCFAGLWRPMPDGAGGRFHAPDNRAQSRRGADSRSADGRPRPRGLDGLARPYPAGDGVTPPAACRLASGENLTFGTLANRSKPAETQASSRYHPLRSHH